MRRVATTPSGGRGRSRAAILDAGIRCFARYGYRRASVGEVAEDAGVSRAILYRHFPTKEALFRSLVANLHEESLRAAAEAAGGDLPVAQRVLGVLEARAVRFLAVLGASGHAAELVDEHHRVCGDLNRRADVTQAKLLAETLTAADARGELALGKAGLTPAAAAEILLAATHGLKARRNAGLTPALYRRRLGEMVRVVLRGLGASARAR